MLKLTFRSRMTAATIAVLLVLTALFRQSMAASASPLAGPLLGITPTFTAAATPTNTATTTPTPTSIATAMPTPTKTPAVAPPAEITKADPVITKRGEPSQAHPGEDVIFTIEVTNQGQRAAVDVVVTDDISPYLEIIEATTSQGTVKVEGQKVTADVGTVGPAFVVTIIIHTRVRADAPVPLSVSNIAILDSPNGGNRSSPPVIVTIPGPLLPVTGWSQIGRLAAWGLVCFLLSGTFIALGFRLKKYGSS